MIEFKLGRRHKGRKSRWSDKYPRKRILRKGNEKVPGRFFKNWNDDNFHQLQGQLSRFLMANIGRPVDKVFSEFLQRCKGNTKSRNLKKDFYYIFKKKEDIDYNGGFYLSNGIINHKNKTKSPKNKYPFANLSGTGQFYAYNSKYFLSDNKLMELGEKAKETMEKQFVGTYYIVEGSNLTIRRATIYVATYKDYEAFYYYMNVANVLGKGIGFEHNIWDSRHITFVTSGIPEVNGRNPEYVFLTKHIL